MSVNSKSAKVLINFLLWGLMALWWLSVAPNVSAKSYDFDEGLEAVTTGLISENRGDLKKKDICGGRTERCKNQNSQYKAEVSSGDRA